MSEIRVLPTVKSIKKNLIKAKMQNDPHYFDEPLVIRALKFAELVDLLSDGACAIIVDTSDNEIWVS